VLAVIVFHLRSSWLPGGFAGVDVFFVISGFVVTTSLKQHEGEKLAAFFGGFYARRLVRIVPALFVMLVTACVCSSLFIPKIWDTDARDAVGIDAFLGISNVALSAGGESYYSPQTGFSPFTHTWSLGVEEQFYLIVPILLFLGFRLAATTRIVRLCDGWSIGLMSIPTIASIVFQATNQGPRPMTAFYSVRSRFWEMAVGSILAMIISARASQPVQPQSRRADFFVRSVAWVGAGLMATGFFTLDQNHFPWPGALIPVVSATLLIGALTSVERRQGALGSKFLVGVGRRSYSLYLWHWPVITMMRWTIGIESFAKIALAAVLSAFLAECSYRFVEPLLPRARSRWSQTRPVSNAKTNVSIVAGAFLVASMAATVQSHARSISLNSVEKHRERWLHQPLTTNTNVGLKCSVGRTEIAWASVLTANSCSGQTPYADRQLFVIGDSHAQMYLPALEHIAGEFGLKIYLISAAGCAFIGLPDHQRCGHPLTINAKVLSVAHPGDLVFAPSLRLRRFSELWDDEYSVSTETAASLAMKSLARPANQKVPVSQALEIIRPLTSHGLRVMFSLPTPIFRSPSLRCSDWFNRQNGICKGGLSINRAFMERYRAPVVTMIETLHRENSSVTSWDPLPSLCQQTTCLAIRNGDPIFRDADHLSVGGNQLLLPSLQGAISANLEQSSIKPDISTNLR
jgi:peptidoglycan/LPS O-acetylase OafA/YrhL